VAGEVEGSGVIVKVVGVPPVAAAVAATVTEPSNRLVIVPTVGASGTSAIGVLPPLTLFNETLLVIVTEVTSN
jgi:hypothetical protein